MLESCYVLLISIGYQCAQFILRTTHHYHSGLLTKIRKNIRVKVDIWEVERDKKILRVAFLTSFFMRESCDQDKESADFNSLRICLSLHKWS